MAGPLSIRGFLHTQLPYPNLRAITSLLRQFFQAVFGIAGSCDAMVGP